MLVQNEMVERERKEALAACSSPFAIHLDYTFAFRWTISHGPKTHLRASLTTRFIVRSSPAAQATVEAPNNQVGRLCWRNVVVR